LNATPAKPSPAVVLPPPPVSAAPPAANPFTPAPAGISLQLTAPTAPQKVGSTFTVAVRLAGGQDIFSVPMEMQYDAQKLSLINVDNGDLLIRDGQIASLVHRDDNGAVHINTSRPQGMKGISGDGTVVVASFLAKAPGDASIAVTQVMPHNSAQQTLPATGGQAVVHVQ
jgi:general secretion pathway protein D